MKNQVKLNGRLLKILFSFFFSFYNLSKRLLDRPLLRTSQAKLKEINLSWSPAGEFISFSIGLFDK